MLPMRFIGLAFERAQHHALGIHGFEANIETPQADHMLEHFFGLRRQRPAQILQVPQRQGAVAPRIG
jgi:hypothetical protein